MVIVPHTCRQLGSTILHQLRTFQLLRTVPDYCICMLVILNLIADLFFSSLLYWIVKNYICLTHYLFDKLTFSGQCS